MKSRHRPGTENLLPIPLSATVGLLARDIATFAIARGNECRSK